MKYFLSKTISFFKGNSFLLFIYFFIVLWGISVLFLNYFVPTNLFILTSTFFLLIFAPGFCLSRIFKIKIQNDVFDYIVLWLALGFIFLFIICSSAMLLGLTVSTLISLYFVAIGAVFLIAFFFDFKKFKNQTEINLNLKNIFQLKNMIFFLLWAFIILVLISISRTGANFVGDPLYHLAIMRKVVEGQPLTIDGLSYIKFLPQLPYVLPVWHVFLGMLTRITDLSIFALWANMPLPLSILVLIVWYYLFKIILPNRNIIFLALFLFIIFFFGSNGYMFARLPVPDTLSVLLLIPLSVVLALKYIFNQESNYKELFPRAEYPVACCGDENPLETDPKFDLSGRNTPSAQSRGSLLILSLSIIMMAVIHFTQYFYFLFIMGFFAITFAIFKYRDPEYKIILRKILLTIFTNILIILPFLAVLELKGKVLSHAMSFYSSVNIPEFIVKFTRYDVYTKIAYIFLPFILLFTQKYKRLVFVLAVFLIIPIVYINVVQVFLAKLLTFVFIKRFYDNVAWPFLIWAVILGFLLLVLDRLISKLHFQGLNTPSACRGDENPWKQTRPAGILRRLCCGVVYNISKYAKYGLDLVLGILAIVSVWAEFRFQTFSRFYRKIIFTENNTAWLVEHYIWLIAIFTILVLILLILQKYFIRIQNFFRFEEIKNNISNFFLVFILCWFLISPMFNVLWKNFNREIHQDKIFAAINDPVLAIVNFEDVGGVETIDFIKNNILPRSVFDSDGGYFVWPLLVDQYMTDYNSQASVSYQKIYQSDFTFSDRLSCIKKGHIDYVLLANKDKKVLDLFDLHPEYFTKIYSDKINIYQINQEKMSQVEVDGQLSCRGLWN